MGNLITKLMTIQTVQTREDLLRCWDAIHALRPHLTQETFLQLYEQMQDEKFQLIFVADSSEKVVAIAGFRYMTTFYGGKTIYIDDLSTLDSARGKGYGSALLDYIFDLAKKEGLNGVHLDSGYQRWEAHRLYLNKKFNLSSHHFVKNISSKS